MSAQSEGTPNLRPAPAAMRSSTPLLMLGTTDGGHAERSGYSVLAQYFPEAQVIRGVRREPRTALERVAVAALRQVAFSQWYRLGSASLEWAAWRAMRRFAGVVHVLWGERDLGFLDRLVDRKRQRLCCTFHGCPDTLEETVSSAGRLRNLDAIILMSETQREFFESRGVAPGRIHVVLHGVDTTYFHPPRDLPAPPVCEVLSVGTYRRDFRLLRDVCEQMEPDRSVRFTVVAASAFRPMFEGLSNTVFRTGVSDGELRRLYQEASCFLMAAEAATANNAILEAMACGLPVISTDVGGISEYVSGECGILVPSRSARDVVAAIGAIGSDATRRRQLARESRRRAESLDWTVVAARTQLVYDAIGL